MNQTIDLELDLQIACDAANLPSEAQFILWATTALAGQIGRAHV